MCVCMCVCVCVLERERIVICEYCQRENVSACRTIQNVIKDTI